MDAKFSKKSEQKIFGLLNHPETLLEVSLIINKTEFLFCINLTVYDAPTCDYPKGMCTYVGDPCPENMERCSQNDKGCPSETNHCCCHVKTAEPGKL